MSIYALVTLVFLSSVVASTECTASSSSNSHTLTQGATDTHVFIFLDEEWGLTTEDTRNKEEETNASRPVWSDYTSDHFSHATYPSHPSHRVQATLVLLSSCPLFLFISPSLSSSFSSSLLFYPPLWLYLLNGEENQSNIHETHWLQVNLVTLLPLLLLFFSPFFLLKCFAAKNPPEKPHSVRLMQGFMPSVACTNSTENQSTVLIKCTSLKGTSARDSSWSTGFFASL